MKKDLRKILENFLNPQFLFLFLTVGFIWAAWNLITKPECMNYDSGGILPTISFGCDYYSYNETHLFYAAVIIIVTVVGLIYRYLERRK